MNEHHQSIDNLLNHITVNDHHKTGKTSFYTIYSLYMCWANFWLHKYKDNLWYHGKLLNIRYLRLQNRHICTILSLGLVNNGRCVASANRLWLKTHVCALESVSILYTFLIRNIYPGKRLLALVFALAQMSLVNTYVAAPVALIT